MLVVDKVSELAGIKAPSPLVLKEAHDRSERIKQLLLLIEGELGWFRDGPADVREVFRKNLDPYDVGYVASLLMMLENEPKFQRWLALTTNRFRFFKGGER